MSAIDEIDYPLLWIVPFSGFTLVTLLSIFNYFISFVPTELDYYVMLSGCVFLCTSVAGLITEMIRGRTKYVYISMSASAILGCIVFFAGYGFFKSNLISSTGQAVVPAIGDVISNISITILPGVFTGALIGGGMSIIPEESEVAPVVPFKEEIFISPEKKFGYEKICRRCSTTMPYDSIYCSQCGGTLKKIKTEPMKYCRYCGERLHFVGEFCPECGKELSLRGRPKVYIAD